MSDKKAKIEQMMAKKRAAAEQRGHTSNGGGSSRTSLSTISSSRVEGNVVIMSAPRVVNKDTYFEAKIEKIAPGSGDGRALVSSTVPNAAFQLAPLTDDKGDYLCKYDSNFKKTDERKPIQLAEFAYATVQLRNAPSGPTDWTTNPAIFPGAHVNIKGAAVSVPFRKGVHVSGSFADSQASSVDAPRLDMEMPAMAFDAVNQDKQLAQRNMMLSTEMGGFINTWQHVPATDKTKVFATTMLGNQRIELLKKDGAHMTALRDVADEGDDKWRGEVGDLRTGLIGGAAFQSGGMGVKFQQASNGPTMMVPLQGLSMDQSTTDGLPGYTSKGFQAMSSEKLAASDLPLFEATMVDTGTNSKSVFGSSRNKDGRATGGPWLNLSINALTMASDSSDPIHLDDPFALKLGLASFPPLVGSKCIGSIAGIATSFLPFCNGVVAFEADLNNVRDNAKAAETFDCRMSTLDLYSGLCKYGIQLDMDAAIATFEDAPLDNEEKEIASTLIGSPKPLLASGFTLLNENLDARSTDWLKQQADQMRQILAYKKRAADVTIEMRAINTDGFDAHKKSFQELEGIDLIDRVERAEKNWLVYAVLVITDKEADESDDESSSSSVEEPVKKKAKSKSIKTK